MRNILVPVDFSDITPRVIDHATFLARNLKAKLWLIHVAAPDPDFVGYEPGPQVVRDKVAIKLHKEHGKLQAFAKTLRRKRVQVTPLLVQGQTIRTILEEAAKTKADYIVLGSHGHGALYRALTGGVCEGVLRKSPCPVVVVPAHR